MRRAAPALVALALAGCGGQTTGGEAGSAFVHVEQRFDRGGPMYIEGSVSYVRLEGPETVERQLDDGLAELEVDAGRYVLQSWQRPCDGNCGYLDPPTDRCETTFEAGAGAALHALIVVRPGKGCTIDVQ